MTGGGMALLMLEPTGGGLCNDVEEELRLRRDTFEKERPRRNERLFDVIVEGLVFRSALMA